MCEYPEIKFPLKLSCGCYAHEFCDCWRSALRFVNYTELAHDRFRYKWANVFARYGVTLPRKNKGSPCPCCGGKDRFVFSDKDGRGTWYCRHCDPCSGGGLLLLSRVLGRSAYDVAKELIDGNEVDYPIKTYSPPPSSDDQEARQKRAARIAHSLLELCKTGSAHDYLVNKGLPIEFIKQTFLTNSEQIMINSDVVPAHDVLVIPLFKMIKENHAEIINVQKIDKKGNKKFLPGGAVKGAFYFFEGDEDVIYLCEGVATGASIYLATKKLTFCAFSAKNLINVKEVARQIYPDNTIIIAADNDKPCDKYPKGVGYQCAFEAIGDEKFIRVPPEIGDWDDFRQLHGIELLKDKLI